MRLTIPQKKEMKRMGYKIKAIYERLENGVRFPKYFINSEDMTRFTNEAITSNCSLVEWVIID